MTHFFPQTADHFKNYFAHGVAAFSQVYTVYITKENGGGILWC